MPAEAAAALRALRSKLRFYADESIGMEWVAILRGPGYDIISVGEDSGFLGKDDRRIYQRAREVGRVLLTSDQDFWDDAKYPLKGTCGIVILASPEPRESAIPGLRLFLSTMGTYGRLMYGTKAKPAGGSLTVKYRAEGGSPTAVDEYRCGSDGHIYCRRAR